jgi:hypothetical protein
MINETQFENCFLEISKVIKENKIKGFKLESEAHEQMFKDYHNFKYPLVRVIESSGEDNRIPVEIDISESSALSYFNREVFICKVLGKELFPNPTKPKTKGNIELTW